MNSYLAAIAHRMKPCHDCGGEADPELYEWVEDEPRKSDYPQRTISSERWRCRQCYDARRANAIVVKVKPLSG